MSARNSHHELLIGADDCQSARIRDRLTRLETAVAGRPGFGRSSQTSATTLVVGLRCRTEEHDWALDTDLPAALGGDSTAPTPSVLLRAAIGSCLAMSYRLRAARHGIRFDSIRVIVETDSAIAGMLVTDANDPAGFTQIRVDVEIVSDAPRETVAAIIDESDRLSPVLDTVSRVNLVTRSLSIMASSS
jgi:uncharacterized OsmC-like protein